MMRGEVYGGFGLGLPHWASAALPRADRLGAGAGPLGAGPSQ